MNEIYHDQSLGAKINVVLVRIIMLGHGKVRPSNARAPPEKLPEIIALIHTVRNSLVTGTHKQTQRHIQSCSHERAQMPRACYSSGLSKRGTKSMQHPRGVFPSRTPSQFSTKAYRNSACYAIGLLPSRLQHRIMGSPGKDNQ